MNGIDLSGAYPREIRHIKADPFVDMDGVRFDISVELFLGGTDTVFLSFSIRPSNEVSTPKNAVEWIHRTVNEKLSQIGKVEPISVNVELPEVMS